MLKYILKRLLLFPITLFAIIVINFAILNAAPGDVIEDNSIDSLGEMNKSDKTRGFKGPDRYLQFREHYGLTLPIFFNARPSISHAQVKKGLNKMVDTALEGGSSTSFVRQQVLWGDRARFIMPQLLYEGSDNTRLSEYRNLALDLFIRGGFRLGVLGPHLSEKEKIYNQKVSKDNAFLISQLSNRNVHEKAQALKDWFIESGGIDTFSYKGKQKWKTFFFETRFCRYMMRVISLDFGTLRNDNNLTVISEVMKRLKSSLILSVIPMIFIFVLCQCFGMIMALYRNRWCDHILNLVFLILFSIPVFVAVPWIVDKLVLNKTLPFTSIPMPYSGLASPSDVFQELTSLEKILDILLHSFLPFCAVSYSAFAAQARLSRSIFLEILNQDYIRAAYTRGLSISTILLKHVGKNASIILVTSVASSLGTILGGALIVETLFDIDGFGKFFYHAILNRDHNVVLFSVLAGSTLSLVGYLIGDISYALLDPRIQLHRKEII